MIFLTKYKLLIVKYEKYFRKLDMWIPYKLGQMRTLNLKIK